MRSKIKMGLLRSDGYWHSHGIALLDADDPDRTPLARTDTTFSMRNLDNLTVEGECTNADDITCEPVADAVERMMDDRLWDV